MKLREVNVVVKKLRNERSEYDEDILCAFMKFLNN